MKHGDTDAAGAARSRRPPQVAGGAAEQAAPEVEMLRTQVDELSQTKVESTSRMPVRIFGAIVSNTVSNSGMANWLENPNITDAEVPGVEPGSFTSTLRQSQIGLNVGPIPMGSWTASGAMVADFFGGVPGFVTGTVFGLPRMVYAFARLEHAGTAVVVGQDHNLLAPRDPTSLAAQAFPLLFRSGNLYLRSPQARVEQKFGGITLKGGMAAPIAADASNFYVFAPPAGAGERSERPALEGRADYTAGERRYAAASSRWAVSARQAWREPALELNSATSWSVDFNARWGRIGFAGEYFDTDDAAEFGSAVAQARPAQGGWVEGRLRLTLEALDQRRRRHGRGGRSGPRGRPPREPQRLWQRHLRSHAGGGGVDGVSMARDDARPGAGQADEQSRQRRVRGEVLIVPGAGSRESGVARVDR